MGVAATALFVALGGGSYAAVTSGDGSTARAGALPSGETLKGLYEVLEWETNTGQGQFAGEVVTYQRPLKQAPTLNFIAEGQGSTTACPGTFATPKAKKGHLCVYEANGGQRDSGDVPFLRGDARDKLGFGLSVLSAANQNGLYFSEGSWAVTAP